MSKISQRPEVYFWTLALGTCLGALSVWGRVDFINAYDIHVAISHGISGLIISILFFLVGVCYNVLSRRNTSLHLKRVRRHILISLVGPMGSLPLFLLGRKISMPITDLLQYATDMQFNDRLMLLSIGLWLITLIWQVMFLIRYIRFLRQPNAA